MSREHIGKDTYSHQGNAVLQMSTEESESWATEATFKTSKGEQIEECNFLEG